MKNKKECKSFSNKVEKNDKQNSISNIGEISIKKQTDNKNKTKNPIMWIITIILMVIIGLFILNINRIISYFTEMKTITNEFSIEANYTVSFNSNSGTGTMESQEISYNVETNLNENEYVKTGYSFDKWNTESDGSGTTYTNSQSVMNLEDIILYAQWSIDTYNLEYILNDGTIQTANPDTYTFETESFTLNNPEKIGYTFMGWSGTELTGNSNMTVTITQGSTGNRSYMANYTPNTYYVKFNSNGGSGYIQDQVMIYDTSYNLTTNINDITRTGYIFNGWNTEPDGSGTSYINNQSVVNLTATNDEVVNLYAQWIIKPTKYAVQIYGINQDVDADGDLLGLTFGPALEKNYNNSYVTHEYEEITENPGNYYIKILTHNVAENGNESISEEYLTDASDNKVMRTTTQVNERKNINIHDMTWEEISSINDKTLFEDCMLCGDTKSVLLALNSILSTGSIYNQYGDGCGTLVNTVKAYYRRWNPSQSQNSYVGTGAVLDDVELNSGSNEKAVGGYSTSHIRATLIGKENAKEINGTTSQINEAYAGNINLEGDTCLYSCIENDLRNVITPKKIKYITGSSTNSYSINENIADAIWLFSERELYGTGQYSGNEAEGLGINKDGYNKFGNRESKYYILNYNTNTTEKRRVFTESNDSYRWWLRSVGLVTSTHVKHVDGGGMFIQAAFYDDGISFGFCIK